MERTTVGIYEDRGERWAAEARPVRREEALALARRIAKGRLRVDLGCGAGRYVNELGNPVIALDAARKMLGLCQQHAPDAIAVQGDLEALPFARATLHGGWANMSYLHLPRHRLPMALFDLHRVLAVGAPLDLQVLGGRFEGVGLPDDRIGGRFFAAWQPTHLGDVLVGAGFDVEEIRALPVSRSPDEVVRARGRRRRSLADSVAADMRLLVCGLNPSIYAADAGVGYARPGNRFWPCALTAGLVSRDRDPTHALVEHGVGMTDLVKEATPNAARLAGDDYSKGLQRVERLVRWLEPGAVCFVGLAGWRSAVNRRAIAGVQTEGFGGCPAYVMPSTSGANASVRPTELVAHLEAAMRLAEP